MATAPGRAAGTVLASPAVDVAAVRNTLVTELAAARAERADLTRRAEECDSVAATLAELPGRTDRSVMIPLGRAAFLPGRLSNSHTVLVRVGEAPLLVSRSERTLLCCAPTLQAVSLCPRFAGRPRRACSPSAPADAPLAVPTSPALACDAQAASCWRSSRRARRASACCGGRRRCAPRPTRRRPRRPR